MTTTQTTSHKPAGPDNPLAGKPLLEKCIVALLAATVAVLAMDVLCVAAVFLLPR